MKAIESNHLLYRNQHNDLFKCINTERVSKRMITYRNQNLFAPPEWYLEHSAKCIKCTTFLQTCIWRTIDLANRKSAALLLSLDFSGTVEISLHFKSREWSLLTAFFFFFFGKTVNRGEKIKNKKEWWFPPLYNLLWSTRARKWEFIAYLRIQTSLTITLFDHSGYRKWFCWAEKNAEVMQPGEKTSGGMTVLVIRALTCSKNALYNISNPKASYILLIMSHILHFKVNMFNLKFWEYYIAHLQFLIFQERKAPFQS